MSRINGRILQVAAAMVLIMVLMLGAMIPPDEDAAMDPAQSDPIGLRQPDGSAPDVAPDGTAGERPRGPGPGMYVAPWLMQVADQNEDGRLTPEEAAQFVRDADEDHNGSIDVRVLALAMSKPLIPPSGNGRGGPGRPGFRRPWPGGWGAMGSFRPPSGFGSPAGGRPPAQAR